MLILESEKETPEVVVLKEIFVEQTLIQLCNLIYLILVSFLHY